MRGELSYTVVVGDQGNERVYLAGTDERDIPSEDRKLIRDKAFGPRSDAVPGAIEPDESGEIPDSLDAMNGKQLDELGLLQDPPIDLKPIRKLEDKRDVLRAAGVGIEEPVAAE